MLYRLNILTGPLKGQQITVEQSPMSVGQSAACNISIPDSELAQQHAIFEHREEGLFVRDLGSVGHILVNRHETHDAKLKHGDEVEMGHTRLLVQALVQPTTPLRPPLARVHRTGRWLLLPLLLILASATFWLTRPPTPPATTKIDRLSAPSKLPPQPPAVANLPPAAPSRAVPSAEELRRLHEEIAIVREAIRLLATHTQTPRPAVTASESAVIITNRPDLQRPQSLREIVVEHPRVRIVEVEQQRLPEHTEFDEMRLLHISLAPATSDAPPPASVTVKTDFFDEDLFTGQILATEALCPRNTLHPEAWQGSTPVTLTASYTVPAGLRDRQLLKGCKLHYRGYRIRLYVGTELHAVKIYPATLLEGNIGCAKKFRLV